MAYIMAITGFRFSKNYRWGVTLWHRLVYSVIPVVMLNLKADGIIQKLYDRRCI